ncbi:hypothetical protein GCM10017673_38690 [Streptosporangium violaceochromogenes]|nr:hypothetical protein GCM10017673_38690 [Streptosporangium violaceochromogenes]
MPIYLRAPEPEPGGPDGRGWNRLTLNAHMGAPRGRCALRPRSYAALFESQDTRRARWGGGFADCTGGGRCGSCPVFEDLEAGKPLRAFTDRVLVRVGPRDGLPYLMNHPDRGWDSSARRWSWEDLARICGWELDGRQVDEHGEAFWLRSTKARPDD